MGKIHKILKQTMDHYGVKGKQLAELTGISQHHLSEFRNGKKWVSEDTLESLLEKMDELSPGSKRYFCELLADQNISKLDNKQLLIDLIENANSEEMQVVLFAIGKKWSSLQHKVVENSDRMSSYADAIV